MRADNRLPRIRNMALRINLRVNEETLIDITKGYSEAVIRRTANTIPKKTNNGCRKKYYTEN